MYLCQYGARIPAVWMGSCDLHGVAVTLADIVGRLPESRIEGQRWMGMWKTRQIKERLQGEFKA